MKKKTLGIALAIAAVIQVAAIVVLFAVALVKHEGRTTVDWTRGLTSQDEEIRLRAVAELSLGGADSVPMLVALLEPQTLVEFLLDPEARDWKEHYPLFASVEQAARAIGEDAVPPAIRILGEGDAAAREAAVRILCWSGADSAPARTAIVDALDDPEAGVRQAAVCALGDLEPGSAAEGEALRGLLEDPVLDVRVSAAGSLWRMTGQADGLLGPIIEDLMREEGPNAYWILDEMGVVAAPVVEDLARALSHPNILSRAVAVRALVKLGPAAAPAAPGLRRLLSEVPASPREEAVHEMAETALAWASPRDPASRRRLLQEAFEHGSREAAALLWKIGLERQRLLKMLLWPRGSRPPLLPDFIDAFGPSAAEATPYLIRTLQPEEELVPLDTTLAAVRTLGRIGPPAAAAGPVLTKLMRGAGGVLEPELALAMFRITGESSEALRVLSAVAIRTGKPDDAPQIAAVRALAVLARTVPEAEDRLIRATRHESPVVQGAAREGLRQLRE